MPQLDVVSYLVQYIWVLFALLVLFIFIVLEVLPMIQRQIVLRVCADKVFKDKIMLDEGSRSIIILKALLNLKC